MSWIKSLKRSTIAIIAIVLVLGGIIAYAAFLTFVPSDPENSTMDPEKSVAVELDATHLTGTIAPGDSKSLSVVVNNPGTAKGMTFVRFTYPALGSAVGAAGSVYTWSVGSGWTVVEEGTGYTVYGYDTPLDAEGSTGSLMNSITMKNLSVDEFKSLGDNVNIQIIGYVAACDVYGDEVQAAWRAANQ